MRDYWLKRKESKKESRKKQRKKKGKVVKRRCSECDEESTGQKGQGASVPDPTKLTLLTSSNEDEDPLQNKNQDCNSNLT